MPHSQKLQQLLAATGFLVLLFSPAAAADYQIEAALDTQTRIISASEVITWTNRTSHPATELRFHLYFNGWRDAKSSFLTSNRIETSDFSEWKEGDWAFQEVSSLVVISPLESEDPEVDAFKQTDLTRKMEFIQPDDGNPNDKTVMRVLLPEPVPPESTIRIRIDFQTKVPRPFARTGVIDDYYFVAHWFPKLGVFEEDGSWNCHQFIQTEFYSEFGNYDVKLRLPAGWVVGATGLLQEKSDHGDGSATHHFVQENVHAFTWTASPHFREFKRRFEHPELPAVDMRLLMMPEHLGQEERYFAATEAALKYYGEWFGAYPYGHVTIIDPAYQSRSGGMEYPTIFTGGTRWLNPEGSGSPEGVTVHECGHQFWYGVIANNEFEHAWLDEGFNTYSTAKVMLEAFGLSYMVGRYLDGFLPVRFEDLQEAPRSAAGLGGYYSDLKLDRMARPSWAYGPASARKRSAAGRGRIYGGGAYNINSYTKPALMLLTLERYLGWETFQKIMSTYFERWKFKHPAPEDFFAVADEISGRDLSWFWDETYRSSNIFDYAVDFVDSTEELQTVVLRRWGEAVFPVQVKVRFENGDELKESWDGKSRWIRFRYPRPEKIEQVVVDPDEVVALDVNRTNNSWQKDAPTTLAAGKWALKWMVWLQHLLEQFAFLM